MGGGLEFIDFLARAGQGCWQFLPTCPTAEVFGHSPYMGLSALAGNTLLISPDLLVSERWLREDDVRRQETFSPFFVEYEKVARFKQQLIVAAFNRMTSSQKDEFCHFRDEQPWLDDYAVFTVAKGVHAGAWSDWPRELASHEPAAIASFAAEYERECDLVRFGQFLFFQQWEMLHEHARQAGVSLCGDIPIYVGHDSVDVWANQRCFELGDDFLPTVVAGVPPDYFSETGQRWGNPLYRWQINGKKNSELYNWWRRRFQVLARQVDMVRIDHFRGFEAYWQIPASEETAMNGRWVKGPGQDFFTEMGDDIATLEIIAEDLGIITPEVEKLRDDLGLPGMKILQFAFDDDEKNPYLPFNYVENCVVYSGTHDNDTAVGWYLDGAVSQRGKDRLRRLANSDGSAVHWDFIRLAYGSVARLAIIPMQDILGFGTDCRMNTPGTTEGNWQWRCAEKLTDDMAQWLRKEALFYNRLPDFPEDELDKEEAVG